MRHKTGPKPAPRLLPLDPVFDFVAPWARAMTPHGTHRRVPGESAAVAMALGVHRRTGLRWESEGVGIDVADAIAVELGTHPACIWPGEWERAVGA